jgi:hypothetical protein
MAMAERASLWIEPSWTFSRPTVLNGSWKMRYIREAIADPDAIFGGLKRPGQEEGLAYSVRPTHDPDEAEPSPVAPRFGYVFIAFVRFGIGGYIVFDWEWREENADAPGHPAGWETDFEGRTWHKT